jgi:hypothetical protein
MGRPAMPSPARKAAPAWDWQSPNAQRTRRRWNPGSFGFLGLPLFGGPGELSPEEQSDTENPARPDAADASSAVNAIAL